MSGRVRDTQKYPPYQEMPDEYKVHRDVYEAILRLIEQENREELHVIGTLDEMYEWYSDLHAQAETRFRAVGGSLEYLDWIDRINTPWPALENTVVDE